MARRLALVLVVGVALSSSLRADFGAPVRITNGLHLATDTKLGIDGANNAFVVSVVDDRLVVEVVGPNLRETLELPEAPAAQGGPDIVTNSAGTTFIAFHQDNAVSEHVGREILLTHNNGGRFLTYHNLSRNAFDDHSPRLDLDIRGIPHAVWSQHPVLGGELTIVMYYNNDTDSSIPVKEGMEPDLAMDNDSVAHIVFLRDSDVYYVNNASGVFENEVKVVNTPTEPESAPSITISDEGILYITFEASGGLKFVSTLEEGGFSPQRLLDGPDVTDPRLSIRAGSLLTIVYAKQGSVHYIQGLSTTLLEPALLGSDVTDGRSKPNLVADLSGNLHACFLENGDVFYTNNAEDVEAEFTATPRSGEVPMTVSFQDLSSGAIAAWRWDFGVHETSTSARQNPTYTFEHPGKYSISLSVFNANRESTQTKQDFIIVEERFNTLSLPNLAVVPNQRDVWLPVIATHPDPIRGFQVMARHDPGILEFRECSLQFTATAAMEPEFFQCNNPEDQPGNVEVGTLFDFDFPFELKSLPRGQDQIILNLVYDVSPDAVPGTVSEVRLENDRSISRIFNIFTVGGFSVFPGRKHSTVTVLNPLPQPPFFLRGDVDLNGALEITDAIKLLGYLFIGTAGPTCPDSADVTDQGRVDISGAIKILNFLFLGGSMPGVPFPKCGIDPSEDSLGPCQGTIRCP